MHKIQKTIKIIENIEQPFKKTASMENQGT